MFKKIAGGAVFAAVLLAHAGIASAHEVQTYEINGVPYEIVIGSLGEPVIVDDKTGVDLELLRDGEPVVGANSTLKVELIAGNTKKIAELAPVYGAEGRYKSPFIATVATTLSYRIFGQLENTPVDLIFTCNPAGHPQSEAMTERKEVAPGVVQTGKTGAFGCPQSKEAFGFPEAAGSELSMASRVAALEALAAQPTTEEESVLETMLMPFAAFMTVVLLGLALIVFRTEKKVVTVVTEKTIRK